MPLAATVILLVPVLVKTAVLVRPLELSHGLPVTVLHPVELVVHSRALLVLVAEAAWAPDAKARRRRRRERLKAKG